MKVLIVEDNSENRKLLRLYVEMLKCEVIEAENGQEGFELATAHKPDLIISDAQMPVMDGFQFLRKLKGDENLRSIPFVFYSGFYTDDAEFELAISLGAKAVITKPKSPAEFQDELTGILEECRADKENAYADKTLNESEYLKQYSNVVFAKLEEKIRELETEIVERKRAEEALKKSETSYMELSAKLSNSLGKLKQKELSLENGREAFLNMLADVNEANADLQELFTGLVTAMVNALDAKSQWTKGHSIRVAGYAVEIAKEIGLEEDEIKNIHLAGLLHDIGKIGTCDYVLDKPAKLTDEEYEMVKRHPVQGYEILREIRQLKEILPLIRHHHERFDGKGYPDGLKGNDIPFGARILHVADTFDAIMADRPYRPSPGLEYAKSEFSKYANQQFDPGISEVFMKLLITRGIKP